MGFKTEVLKKLDFFVGGVASQISRYFFTPRKGPNPVYTKILVIRPGGIGDAVLLYPALGALRASFKDSRIDVLAERRNAGILKGCPYVDRVFQYDVNPPFELLKVIRTDYDMVIDTEQWHRLSAVTTYLTGAPVRVGFDTNGERKKLLTHPVSYSQDEYEVYSFLKLVSQVTGIEYGFDKESPFLPVGKDLVVRFGRMIGDFRRSWDALVGVFTGATVRERRWGIKKFSMLSKELSKEGIGTVLVGGREDVGDAKRFKEALSGIEFLNFVGKTTILETAAIISQLDLFISSDTGLMHIAYGVGTPTVSLFGAGIQRKWAPPGRNHVVINKGLPCSPCTKFGYTPACPYGVRCLGEIAVGEVKERVVELLSRIRMARQGN